MKTVDTKWTKETIAEVPEFYSGIIRYQISEKLYYLHRKEDNEVLAVCKTFDAAQAAARLLLSK